MADEGIMALPQGTGMQGEQPPVQQQAVTSADSYDAAQTALGRVNPGEQAALKEALRQNIGNLQLTPQQLDALIQVFEYVSQHPGDYKNLLQKMLEAGVLDEGDMPPEYDPEFIGAMLAVLNEMQQMQAAGAQEPMDLSPVVQGLQPMGMASGGLADIGQYLASKGRGGDSMLAHINPEEAAMLKRRGGSGTINPNTGLPEFKEGALGGVFDAIGGALKGVANVAKDLLKSPVGRILGTIALATVLGPAGLGLSMGSTAAASAAINAGLAGAGVSVLGGGSMKEALISGAMGYIGGGGTVMGVNPVEAVGSYLPGAAGTGIGAAGGALNTGLATGLIGAGIGKLGGMSTEDALRMGLTSGVSAGAMKAFGGMSQADYDVKNQLSTRALNGDIAARDVYLRDNPAEMADFLKASPTPVSTTQPAPNPVSLTQPLPGQAFFPESIYGAGQSASQNLMGVPETQYGAGNLKYAANAGKALPAAPVAGPPGFFDKALTGAGKMYDTYLSPDRAGLPSDVSFFRKYGPLAAAGTATIAAFGGMDSSPAEIDPITAGERARYAESRLRAKARRDRIEKGGYGLEGNRPLIYAADGGYGLEGNRPLIYAADGGYIQRFVAGSDADGVLSNDERRRLAQERRRGYGLEGNLLDTALAQARTGNAARPFDEYFVNNSGDQRGPGTDNTGGIPGLNIDPLALGLGRVAGLFGSSVSLGLPAPVDERSSYTSLAQAEADAVAARAAQAEANIADSEGKGDFLGGSDSFGEGQYAKGGPAKMTHFPRRDGPINGPGTGTSDDIPAMLSDGEFVFTAKAVRNAGGGSRRKGAARMYKLMKKLEGGAVKGN